MAARSQPKYPKTTFITITTHGCIYLTPDMDIGNPNVIPRFDINPKISKMFKYNAVSPGVINFVAGNEDINVRDIERFGGKAFSESDVETINNTVRENIRMYPKDLNKVLDSVNTAVSSQMMREYSTKKQEVKELEDKKKATGKLAENEQNLIQMYKDYVDYFDRGRKWVDCLRDGDRKMIKKSYVIQEGNIQIGEDWAITCLNFEGSRENLFDTVALANGVARTNHRDRVISIEQIVNYLADNGVEELIVIDLTCCPFLQMVNGREIEQIGTASRRLNRAYFTAGELLNGRIKYGGRSSKRRNTRGKGRNTRGKGRNTRGKRRNTKRKRRN